MALQRYDPSPGTTATNYGLQYATVTSDRSLFFHYCSIYSHVFIFQQVHIVPFKKYFKDKRSLSMKKQFSMPKMCGGKSGSSRPKQQPPDGFCLKIATVSSTRPLLPIHPSRLLQTIVCTSR